MVEGKLPYFDGVLKSQCTYILLVLSCLIKYIQWSRLIGSWKDLIYV